MIPLALANILVVAFAILLTPGRTNGLVFLSCIFGGLFVLMYLWRSSGRRSRGASGSRRCRASASE